MQEELTKEHATDLDHENANENGEQLTTEHATDLDHENANENEEELTPEKAEALGKAVSEFTML